MTRADSENQNSQPLGQSPALVIDALGWVHVRNRQLLCVRSRGKDAFYLPGGKRESGESDWQAIAREVREELQVELDLQSFQPFATFNAPAHGYTATTRVILACYQAEFRGEIQPSAEIEEIAWFGYGDRYQCAPATALVLDQLHQQSSLSD